MISCDIHFGRPTVFNAINHLKIFLNSVKKKEKIVEVITGYGSTGGTHKIKTATLNFLEEKKEEGYIKDFIWGNELDIFNQKYQTFKYKELIPDICKRQLNAGSVYIIL